MHHLNITNKKIIFFKVKYFIHFLYNLSLSTKSNSTMFRSPSYENKQITNRTKFDGKRTSGRIIVDLAVSYPIKVHWTSCNCPQLFQQHLYAIVHFKIYMLQLSQALLWKLMLCIILNLCNIHIKRALKIRSGSTYSLYILNTYFRKPKWIYN